MEIIDEPICNTLTGDTVSQDLFLMTPGRNSIPCSYSYEEEQQRYYKESIMLNYQRYKALFRSRLLCNVLIDDKNIVRDINKTAREELSRLLGVEIKIGVSLNSKCTEPFQKILRSSLNEMTELELMDQAGNKHLFQVEIILLVSPEENGLLKCISAVKIR